MHMKPLVYLLFVILFISSCSRPTENKTVVAPDSLNQVLYKQIMEVHDEIMPGMEKIYKLKQDIEVQIANTPNLTRTHEKELELVITNLDSANNSMLTWMQQFSPLPDSAEVIKARTYLEHEFERVKEVRRLINERIAQAEAELAKEASKNKKTTKASTKTTKEKSPIVTTVEPNPTPVKEEVTEPIVFEPIITEMPKDSIAKTVVAIDSSAHKKSAVKPVEKKPEGKPFYFKLVNSESGSPVTGEVHIMEAKATQYQGFKGNELIYLKAPKNIAGVYQAAIQAPGYKPAKLVFNYKDTEPISSGVGEQEEVIVTFELVRAKRGDYIDFNEVRFFRNTTILEPQSIDELNGLASLMKEDPYKIKIHGHCNSDEPRTVTTIGTSTNIFALDPTHNKREMLTAKQLTELRAEVVKNYLVKQGIEADRIDTKGEGGKMMIYPRTSTLANRNDRVEIEVLKSK